MYETDAGFGLGLAPETRERMREVFGGQTCHRCGAPAVRLVANQFYCVAHFPRRGRVESNPPRVYHCVIGLPR